jgi:xylulose-5-phosphate/fructose-6-phosphate phosphoketolase
LPQLGASAAHLKQELLDKLIEHKEYITQYGQDLPEVRNWQWENLASTG